MLRSICYDTDTEYSVFHRYTDDIRHSCILPCACKSVGYRRRKTFFLDYSMRIFSQNIIYASWRYTVQPARHYTGNGNFLALAQSVSATGNSGHYVILSIDLFSSAANMLISLSLPVTLSQQVKAMIFMLFIYFGLIPVAAVMITGFVLGQPDLFMLISAAVNIILSAVCAIISGGCIVRGRK